jgi:hypothetical protein
MDETIDFGVGGSGAARFCAALLLKSRGKERATPEAN